MAKKGGNNDNHDYKGLIDFIIKEDGFLKKPTDIGDGKITLGSGLTDPKWHKLYKERGNKWSAEDNRKAVEEEVKTREKYLSDSFPNWGLLPKKAQEALIAYNYNYNFTPSNSPRMYKAAAAKDFKELGNQINATSKDPKFKNGLEDRRERERDYYFSGFSTPEMAPVIPVPVPVTETPKVIFTEQPDALRNYRQPVTPSNIRRDAYKAMQDKVNFNRFMNSISIQNTLPSAFESQFNLHSEGGQMETVKLWEELSIPEKAAMMRVAVKNGITNLQDIKREYNEFAKGGPKKKATSGWYQQHQNRWYNFLKNKGLNDVDSARLSGFFTAQDDLESAGGKSNAAREKNNFGGMQRGGKNIRYNTVEDYMQDKWKMMNSKFKSALGAKNIDEYATILGNPETAGKGYLYYVTDKVKYDPKSPQWKAAQRQHMQNYINGMRSRAGMGTVRFNNQPIASAKPSITPTTPIAPINPSISQESLESPIPFTPFNPEAFFATPETYQQPIVVEEPEVQEPVAISPYSPEEIDRQERMNRLSTFNRILSLTNPYPQEEDSFLSTIGLLTGNTFSKGGGIHIKPENRGKFTALKKRTGHSASWFKAHGTPAQKKMATFALNARKWKHK